MTLKELIERVMAIGDLCSDVFFASDIFVQFHTAEWVVSTVGRPHFRLRHSLREIRASYMKSTFAFDLLGIIPVQYVDCVFEPGTLPSGIKALHLVRLIKLLRLYRIRKLIKVCISLFHTQSRGGWAGSIFRSLVRCWRIQVRILAIPILLTLIDLFCLLFLSLNL
jgi:hypothetical protein